MRAAILDAQPIPAHRVHPVRGEAVGVAVVARVPNGRGAEVILEQVDGRAVRRRVRASTSLREVGGRAADRRACADASRTCRHPLHDHICLGGHTLSV